MQFDADLTLFTISIQMRTIYFIALDWIKSNAISKSLFPSVVTVLRLDVRPSSSSQWSDLRPLLICSSFKRAHDTSVFYEDSIWHNASAVCGVWKWFHPTDFPAARHIIVTVLEMVPSITAGCKIVTWLTVRGSGGTADPRHRQRTLVRAPVREQVCQLHLPGRTSYIPASWWHLWLVHLWTPHN